MSQTLNHHPCVALHRMQPFLNSSELLDISCSHKNYMTVSQTVQESLFWQTNTHPQADSAENNPPRYNVAARVITKTSNTLNHNPCASDCSASEGSHFLTRLSLWPYFAPIKISRWYLKGCKSYHVHKHTHPQTDSADNDTTFAMLSLHQWYHWFPRPTHDYLCLPTCTSCRVPVAVNYMYGSVITRDRPF